jgi:RNA polymerase sigma-70 factor, ECF subfamily
MPTLDQLEQHRSAMFGLAYRMLGSVMDAEDIVQEAFMRSEAIPEDVRSLRAYLITMVTRMCVDQLRLAHVQREEYVGMWLPEPLIQSPESDPAQLVELDESISTAFLVLLENLSPLDRAVFLLHEVFNYTFAEIAPMVGRTPADCRQIGHRARQRLMDGRPRFEVEPEAVEPVVQQFLAACLGGDLSQLMALLTPDVTVTNDSGGKVTAIRKTIIGQDRVGRLFLGIFRRWWAHLSVQIRPVNGQPALMIFNRDQLYAVSTFDIREGKIQAIFQVLNPDKLKGYAEGGDDQARSCEG